MKRRTADASSSDKKRVKLDGGEEEVDEEVSEADDAASTTTDSDEEASQYDVASEDEEEEASSEDVAEEILPPIAESPAIAPGKHLATYRRILERAASKRTAIPDHQAFEYAWALKMKYLVYRDVPPNYIRACGIEDTRDFGTDLVSCDRKGSAQVKLYGDSTGVTFADMAKFYTHSDLLGATERRAICTTPGAPVTRNARNVATLRDIEIQRSSLDDLITEALVVEAMVEEVAPASSSWTWRRGQLKARDAFLASDEKTFRVQLPCGYGKTALIALVAASRTADEKLLVLVPSKDLLHQTAERLRALMRVTICKVGDGESALDLAANVVVATHAHLTRGTLDGTKWGLVVVDEAHHCVENGARAKLDAALDAPRFLELSATFPKGVHVHFKVSMREAIDEGVVADYRVRVVELTAEGEKRAAILTIFKERYVDWGPSLAVFNDVQGTRDFARALREAGIEAESVDADTPASVRKQIAERLETGETSVVCCCGCWNEGVDIQALRSVVFCDARDSDVNKRQLAQRASRLHPCKPYYNIVLFVRQELDDVEGLLRSFADDDPAFRASAHAAFGEKEKGGPVNSRITVEHSSSAEVVGETLLTRLGEVLLGKKDKLTTQEKVDMLIAQGEMPKWGEMLGRFVNGIQGYWAGRKPKIGLTQDQMRALEASWMKTVICKWKAPKLSFAQKMQCVAALEKKPGKSDVTSFKIGTFVRKALVSTSNGSERYQTLMKVKWFVEALVGLKSFRENPPPSEKQKIAWLIEYGTVPPQKLSLRRQLEGRTYLFNIGSYWGRTFVKALAGKASNEQRVLEQHEWYNAALLGAKKLTFTQKMECVLALHKRPAQMEVTTFSIGTFVNTALQATVKGSKSYEPLTTLKWFADALAGIKMQRAEKLPEPSEKQKIAWLIEFVKAPAHDVPQLEKQFEGRTYLFNIAAYWSRAMRKAAAGKTSEKQRVLERHEWYNAAVRKFEAKRSKNSLGRVPLQTQIEWLIQLGHRPRQSESVPKEYGGKEGPWNAGTFVCNIVNGRTKLSAAQKERLLGCTWTRELTE